MSLLSFLFQARTCRLWPTLRTCIAEHLENLQAYHSQRSADFANWDKFDPVLRRDILDLVRRPFCAFGYHRTLLNARTGDSTAQEAMSRFCDEPAEQGGIKEEEGEDAAADEEQELAAAEDMPEGPVIDVDEIGVLMEEPARLPLPGPVRLRL
ncbi:hypothetical protein JCM11251_003219 [Rhodosporidiobolus azoricus]